MDIGDEILRKYNEVFNNLPKWGRGKLRFGRNTVSVSSIAEQYYCEKKLDLMNEYPVPPSEQMVKGEVGHTAASTLGIVVSKEEAVIEAVKEREEAVFFCEFNIAWIHNGVPIIGMVDEAWFQGGSIGLVVERKFSNNLTVYNPYHVQAQLYCLGLGEMGFDNTSTYYMIVVLKRSCHECGKLIDRSCQIFKINESEFKCDNGKARAFVYPFDKDRILDDLDWALDFWLNKRRSIPTMNKAKCRVCEYNSLCNSG